LVKIIAFDSKTNSPIFSEKAAGENIPLNIKKGDVLEGVVSGVTDFGIFVNLGNFDGLVHISEASWNHIDDLNNIAKVGDKIRVKVISIESGRVFLSLKRLTPDPFLPFAFQHQANDIISGEVLKITPYGVLVKIKDLEITVKLPEPSKQKIEVGKKYHFQILKIDKKGRKIDLDLEKEKKTKSKKKEE